MGTWPPTLRGGSCAEGGGAVMDWAGTPGGDNPFAGNSQERSRPLKRVGHGVTGVAEVLSCRATLRAAEDRAGAVASLEPPAR